ncbi:hypothetical protein POSPLADRAFT_1045644 [Postia placenta MAD-698-R-SB12]|uniref:Uncharacterized protein n=1 Tax=Postia placenta MAD-698-R-SB12 TaxID=670580 RepID=A0A1X6N3R3_9APHY|nr:hypothetical protein POSPLADRAFT_1045644 [Postia placenta MAD-698-R-SB12]OSX63267.1 hypothetical protein POSPLADRAFT_1045644 [Postia placenta MAD-698-R-SB12]
MSHRMKTIAKPKNDWQESKLYVLPGDLEGHRNIGDHPYRAKKSAPVWPLKLEPWSSAGSGDFENVEKPRATENARLVTEKGHLEEASIASRSRYEQFKSKVSGRGGKADTAAHSRVVVIRADDGVEYYEHFDWRILLGSECRTVVWEHADQLFLGFQDTATLTPWAAFGFTSARVVAALRIKIALLHDERSENPALTSSQSDLSGGSGRPDSVKCGGCQAQFVGQCSAPPIWTRDADEGRECRDSAKVTLPVASRDHPSIHLRDGRGRTLAQASTGEHLLANTKHASPHETWPAFLIAFSGVTLPSNRSKEGTPQPVVCLLSFKLEVRSGIPNCMTDTSFRGQPGSYACVADKFDASVPRVCPIQRTCGGRWAAAVKTAKVSVLSFLPIQSAYEANQVLVHGAGRGARGAEMGGSTARQTRGPWTRSAAARDTKRRSDPAWIRVPKAAIPPPHATECAAAGSRTSSCSDKVRPRRRVETLSDVSTSSAADTVMGGCLAGWSTRRQPRVPAEGGRAGSSASAVCIKSELRPGIEGAYCYALGKGCKWNLLASYDTSTHQIILLRSRDPGVKVYGERKVSHDLEDCERLTAGGGSVEENSVCTPITGGGSLCRQRIRGFLRAQRDASTGFQEEDDTTRPALGVAGRKRREQIPSGRALDGDRRAAIGRAPAKGGTAERSIEANPDELDAKLELLSQLCLTESPRHSRKPSFVDEPHARDNPSKPSYVEEHWLNADYSWVSDAAHDSAVDLSTALADEEDGAHLYDPTFFSDPRTPTSETHSAFASHPRAYGEKDKANALLGRCPLGSGNVHRAKCGWGKADYPNSAHFGSEKDHLYTHWQMPLPEIPRPSLVRAGVPDAPPPSPRTASAPFFASRTPPRSPPRSPLQMAFSLSPPRTAPTTPSATPPTSPRISSSPPRSPKAHTFPRGPQRASQPDARPCPPDSRPQVPQRHATFPSISSTLENLGERTSPTEKRSGMYVADPSMAADGAPRMRSASASIGRSNGETIKPVLAGGSQSPQRKQRPTLPTLSTSSSSPQLRTFPGLASASTASSSYMSSESPVTLVGSPIVKAPAALEAFPSDSLDDEAAQPSSRWSLDSVASRPAPSSVRTPAEPTGTQPQASAGRKRDRLLSFITRGRSGSLGKAPALPNSPPPPPQDVLDIRCPEPSFEMVTPRPSLSVQSPLQAPSAISVAASSSSSSSAGSSRSSLPTPAEPMPPRLPPKFSDPFASAPDTEPFILRRSVSHRYSGAPSLLPPFELPPRSEDADYDRPPTPSSPPLEPTLPPPSPGTPSPSFYLPPRQDSSFLSSLGIKRVKRRQKKLVISNVQPTWRDDNPNEPEQERRERVRKQRYENVVLWCKSFGEIRKLECKPDGSVHVYYREWEVADMVCRVHGQVYIKDVGRVNLSWHYLN